MEIAEKKASKMPAVFTLVATFLSGGFAGSVFTWYVNRPQATVIAYTISTTSLGTSEVSSVVPNLRLQIGSENVESIYTHTVELTPVKGPFADQAEFALTLPPDARVFGIRTDAPTSLHAIACTQFPGGAKCKAGPLSSKIARPFKIVLATNRRDQPGIELVAKNTDLVSGADYIKQNQQFSLAWPNLPLLILSLVAGLSSGFAIPAFRAMMRDTKELQDLAKSLREAIQTGQHGQT